MEKKAVSGIMLTLLLTSMLTLAFNIQPVKAEPIIWTVDDDLQDYPDADFRKIQDAVNAATDGDIILVYLGTYIENVNMNKGLTIKSHSGAVATVVQARTREKHVFTVTADWVEIRGFTVKGTSGDYINPNAGIHCEDVEYCGVSDNIVIDNWDGIHLYRSSFTRLTNNTVKSNEARGIWLYPYFDGFHRFPSHDNNITNNIIINNGEGGGGWGDGGICLWRYSDNNTIVNNVVSSNEDYGIYADQGSHNDISNNTVSGSDVGIYLSTPCYKKPDINNVANNTVLNNGKGILLQYSSGNRITNNIVSSNYCGIELYEKTNNNLIVNNIALNNTYGIRLISSYLNSPSCNILYHNDMINNTYNALESSAYGGGNQWYNSTLEEGNFYSDYIEEDTDGDGIGDTPHTFGDGVDYYPLMKPHNVGPPPPNQPPTCSIELRKDGVEIDEIEVGQFFDIYVRDSTDDIGIREVRFSSDDFQDGNPTGEWTEWYDWDNSLGDWNASTKIKRWAFATGGDKEVWAEVKDDVGQSAKCSANIYANESIEMKIVRLITQEAIEGVPVTVDGKFYIILTLKSRIDPITLEVVPNVMTKVYVEAAENYPVSDPEIARKIGVIDYVGQLQKDELYEKYDSLNKKLLALGTLPLAEWSIEAVEKILGVIKILSAKRLIQEVIKIAGKEIVTHLLNSKEELRKQVEEDYKNAMDDYFLAWKTLLNEDITDYAVANTVLEKYLWGKFYEEMGLFLSTKIFPGETWEFFVRELGDVFTWGISEESLARIISIDYEIKYWNEKGKIQCQLSKKPYETASYALELARVPSELTEEFNKCITEIEEETARIREAVADYLERFSFKDYLGVILDSPGELRVYDSQERITGLVNGEVKKEIPNSWYYNNTVAIFFPSDSYRYEVAGTDEGAYGLTVISVKEGEATTFTATDIPTSANAIHQYTTDWAALSGGEGVTVKVDSDGDGTFEKTFAADSELTRDEFKLQVSPVEAFPMCIVGVAVATIAIATAAIAVFRRKRKQLPIKN